MSTRADFLALQDSKFTITYPGNAFTIKFDTDPNVCRSCPFVLYWMLDTVGDPDGLRVRIELNGDQIGEYKHSRSRFAGIHEIVSNTLLKPTGNDLVFLPLSGEGEIEYSDVVLLYKIDTK